MVLDNCRLNGLVGRRSWVTHRSIWVVSLGLLKGCSEHLCLITIWCHCYVIHSLSQHVGLVVCHLVYQSCCLAFCSVGIYLFFTLDFYFWWTIQNNILLIYFRVTQIRVCCICDISIHSILLTIILLIDNSFRVCWRIS